jgi:hypothetical protein
MLGNCLGAMVGVGIHYPVGSIGFINVKNPIRMIMFHILKALTHFLICLRNIDWLKVYFNNTTNEIISADSRQMGTFLVLR